METKQQKQPVVNCFVSHHKETHLQISTYSAYSSLALPIHTQASQSEQRLFIYVSLTGTEFLRIWFNSKR